MHKYFNIPFATSGDKNSIPDTDVSGAINWTEGYPLLYSQPYSVDPLAKAQERTKFNQLMFDVTTAIKELQDVENTVDTVADLVNVPSHYTFAFVRTESEPFTWSATGTADNFITYAGATGYWVRQFSGDVKASWASDFIALVAYCYTNSKTLNMDTNVTVTANVPHLHDIKYSGWGSITNSTAVFYPTLTMGSTNTIYVSTTGLDTNDGITAANPMLTTQNAGNTIYKYGYGDVTWKIQHAAGTFTQNTFFSKPFPCPNRVQFLGVSTPLGTVPTTIFASPTGAGKTGIYVSNGARAYIESIKFTGYKDGVSPSVSGSSSAISGSVKCEIYTKNVHVYNCDQGIENAFEGMLRVQGGIIDNCAQGIVCISNTSFTIGYYGSAADLTGATGTAVTNCTGYGIIAQEGATGHVDYCYIKGNSNGVSIISRSRVHLLGSTLDTNTNAIKAIGNSTWYNNPTVANTFTGNTADFVMTSGSVEESFEGTANAISGYVLRDTASYSTQSATPVTAITKTIPALFLKNRGAGFDFELFWTCVGTANTKTVTVKLNGVSIASRVITATTTSAFLRIKFVNRTNASQQKAVVIWEENGVAPVVTISTSYTFDFSADMDLTVEHSVTNVADSSRIQHADLRIVH